MFFPLLIYLIYSIQDKFMLLLRKVKVDQSDEWGEEKGLRGPRVL